MLSKEYIEKVGRLMYQTGGYPVGAYDISQEYRSAENEPSVFTSSENSLKEKSVKLRLEYFVDAETGDVRIVQK
ncbi:hypothetical protein J4456_03115 [Candidatus Pacearchaeota archaeon]|nr:hypothetical protein [Candidatus Pacearchaeota archaeon]